jgi:outer membrane protein
MSNPPNRHDSDGKDVSCVIRRLRVDRRDNGMTRRRVGKTAGQTGFSALFLVGVLGLIAIPATQAAEPAANRDWTMTVGVEGRVMPGFEGSASSVLRPVPIFRIRRAGTPDSFRSARDGGSVALYDAGRFKLGPTVKFRYARKESDDTDLRGLGDIDWAVEPGAFAEFWLTDWLRTRAELRQGIGGHHGLVSDLSADVVAPVTGQLTLSGGPRMTLASAKATSPYFSITPAQSAASGLAVYDAGGGLRSFGAGAQARYAWTPRWAGHMFFEYERLAGDAANSPLVTQRGSRDQIQVGIGTTYAFDVPGLW